MAKCEQKTSRRAVTPNRSIALIYCNLLHSINCIVVCCFAFSVAVPSILPCFSLEFVKGKLLPDAEKRNIN